MAMSLQSRRQYRRIAADRDRGMDYLGDQAIRRAVGKSGIGAAHRRLGSEVIGHGQVGR